MLIVEFPPELFIEFCIFLSPTDLFALSQVCRKFQEYLCAPNSFSTQQIWKESRLKFMSKEDMPPPVGMTEKKYVELLMTERGCQICKQIKECKIYWEFEVRCCEECRINNTIYRHELTLKMKYPSEFINVMPYTNYGIGKYYWAEQIAFAYSQYNNLSKENLQSWLNDKKLVSDSLMEYAERRKLNEEKIGYPPFSFDSLTIFSTSLFDRDFGDWMDRITWIYRRCWVYENCTNTNNVENAQQLVQFHIQRLENEATCRCNKVNIKDGLRLKRNYHKNFNESKRNNYIKNNKFNMNGKYFKNKLLYRYR
ncbi:hypothetical protein GLOIN_2v1868710 [Rhizophagus clarus]|uniref:F-box domain-containing protein n=1 Tax=Rhizophagus clarus TaxID=94130 RepID=A0A8H3LPI7_9GLOM|nr:hypothetical protein GLOIN_2v1868710 [Rhizophagus clarus]